MKTKRFLQMIMMLMFVCLFVHTNTAAATKTVYSVDRYGELYNYSGSPVVPIRSNVSAISKNAFNGVKTTSFTTSGNAYFKSVNGVLYSKDGTLLVKCPTEKQGSFTIPSSVRKIAHSAFENCNKLTRITIPDSVTTIEPQAFYHCSALRQVRISNYVKTVPDEAFSGCSSLVSVNIPATATAIGYRAFYHCQSLTGISLPDSVSSVGSSAFSGCLSLKRARLSGKMRRVADSMFLNCTELRTVENTGSIEEIGWYSFKNCVQLKTFSYTNKLDIISGDAFQNCIKLGTVVITKGTRRINHSAFNGAASKFIVDADNPNYSSRNGMLLNEKGDLLIQAPIRFKGELNIPRGVTSIESDALTGGQFTSISVPEGVTKINKSQFRNCENLRSIYLPASLKSINGILYSRQENLNLKKLERVVVARGNQDYFSADGVAYSADGTTMVFYPSGKTGSFHLPDTCKRIGNFMQDNKLTSISVSSKNKYFTSTGGVLYDSKGQEIVCFPMRKKNYRIPETVRDIRYLNKVKADLKCKAVKVSSKNKKFSSKAGVIFDADSDTLLFYPPKKKGAYKIPVSTRYIDEKAFDDAHKLTALTITKNIKRSRYSTFYFKNCRSLKRITVNQGELNYISMNFSGCQKLSSLTFPSTIMTTNLKNLPMGVTIYGWKNTYAKEAAEDAKGKFVSRGTIPNVVSGVKIKKIIDKYQVSWNATSEASGYQVYTSYSTIKNLSGSGNTSCFIGNISKYRYDSIYIRAYKIVNGKKVYGKARAISI